MRNLARVSIGLLCGFVLLSILCSCVVAQAQNADPKAALEMATASSPSAVLNADGSVGALSPEQRFRWLQEEDKRNELIALIVAMTVALLIVLMFLRNSPNYAPEHVVRAGGLVLVIFGTLFISVYASTADQLTAPIGILGAVAGYLFGSAQRHSAGGDGGARNNSRTKQAQADSGQAKRAQETETAKP